MLSYLNQERKVPGSRTVYKWKQPNTVLNMSVDFDVVGKQGMGFFTGGSIIIDYEFIFWPKQTLILHKMFIDGLESCGLFVN